MIKIFEKIFITLNFTYMCLQMYNDIHHLLTIYIIIEKKKKELFRMLILTKYFNIIEINQVGFKFFHKYNNACFNVRSLYQFLKMEV